MLRPKSGGEPAGSAGDLLTLGREERHRLFPALRLHDGPPFHRRDLLPEPNADARVSRLALEQVEELWPRDRAVFPGVVLELSHRLEPPNPVLFPSLIPTL
jgi:hypothetical protein